jgi:hypothetical protein
LLVVEPKKLPPALTVIVKLPVVTVRPSASVPVMMMPASVSAPEGVPVRMPVEVENAAHEGLLVIAHILVPRPPVVLGVKV